jgi:hypothetical protein
MQLSHRIAALAAVVAVPLGIAATSYALSDRPDEPRKAPARVELEGSPSPEPTPSDVLVPGPEVTDRPPGGGPDDDHDDADDADDADDRDDASDDDTGSDSGTGSGSGTNSGDDGGRDG